MYGSRAMDQGVAHQEGRVVSYAPARQRAPPSDIMGCQTPRNEDGLFETNCAPGARIRTNTRDSFSPSPDTDDGERAK
jgi:hypothetical protein